jgi:hypothetical protein
MWCRQSAIAVTPLPTASRPSATPDCHEGIDARSRARTRRPSPSRDMRGCDGDVRCASERPMPFGVSGIASIGYGRGVRQGGMPQRTRGSANFRAEGGEGGELWFVDGKLGGGETLASVLDGLSRNYLPKQPIVNILPDSRELDCSGEDRSPRPKLRPTGG